MIPPLKTMSTTSPTPSLTTLLPPSPRTLLGPLLTTHTPPASCSFAVFSQASCLSAHSSSSGATCTAWLGNKCESSSGGIVHDDPQCWPSPTPFASVPAGAALNGWGFYSPGIACPAGWVSACTSRGGRGTNLTDEEDVQGNGGPFQFGLAEGETGVGCCPSGYTCASTSFFSPSGTLTGMGYAQTCISHISAPMPAPTYRKISLSFFDADACGPGINSFGSFGLPSGYVSAFVLKAPMVEIVWQASDREGGNGTGVESGTSSAPGEGGLDGGGPQGEEQEGLSAGAKAGIAIGAAIGAILLGVLAWVLLWRRSSRRTAEAGPGAGGETPGSGQSALESIRGVNKSTTHPDMTMWVAPVPPGPPPSEMYTLPPEMDTHRVPVEMPAARYR